MYPIAFRMRQFIEGERNSTLLNMLQNKAVLKVVE